MHKWVFMESIRRFCHCCLKLSARTRSNGFINSFQGQSQGLDIPSSAPTQLVHISQKEEANSALWYCLTMAVVKTKKIQMTDVFLDDLSCPVSPALCLACSHIISSSYITKNKPQIVRECKAKTWLYTLVVILLVIILFTSKGKTCQECNKNVLMGTCLH